MESESRYQPGDYRIGVSVESARESIVDNIPNFKVEEIENLGEGMGTVAFLVNGAYIFRFAKYEKAKKALEQEALILPKIQEHLSTAVPQFEYIGRDRETGRQFVGYKQIEGESLSKDILIDAEGRPDAKIVKQIADFFRELHSFDVNTAKESGVKERNMRQFFLNELEDAREHLYPVLENMYPNEAAQIKKYIETLFQSYLEDAKNFDYAPALLHGDLEAEHIIYDSETQKIAGIIDWGGVHIGDPDYDLWRPYSHYGKEFIESLLKFYPHADPEQLFKKLEFFFRAQMIHKTVRALLIKDHLSSQRKMKALRKQALGLGYWYDELAEE